MIPRLVRTYVSTTIVKVTPPPPPHTPTRLPREPDDGIKPNQVCNSDVWNLYTRSDVTTNSSIINNVLARYLVLCLQGVDLSTQPNMCTCLCLGRLLQGVHLSTQRTCLCLGRLLQRIYLIQQWKCHLLYSTDLRVQRPFTLNIRAELGCRLTIYNGNLYHYGYEEYHKHCWIHDVVSVTNWKVFGKRGDGEKRSGSNTLNVSCSFCNSL